MIHRPEFHITPESGRLNDPNGLIFHNDRWHAFYQIDPGFPRGPKQTGWGHVVSADLVAWERLPQALFPDQRYDRNGCYSGSATVTDDGTVEFFYTGNVKYPDGSRGAHQCVATSSDPDLRTLHKAANNPLIESPPHGFTTHFRDPHMAQIGHSHWRMVIGAQTDDKQGAAVIYESTDLRNWGEGFPLRFDGPVPSGYMWECPNLVDMVDEHDGQTYQVLILCPQGIRKESGEDFRNRYQCGYIVGHLGAGSDRDLFTVTSPFRELDHGFEFYAPQVFAGTDRHLMLGWLGSPEEDDHPSLNHKWVHCLSAVREFRLVGGQLRQSLLVPDDLPTAHDGENHCIFQIDLAAGEHLTLHSAKNGADRVDITITGQRIEVRRACSLLENPFGSSRSTTLPSPTTGARVIVDRSVIEIITHDGSTCLSLRAFADSDLWHVKKKKLDASHNTS